MRIRVATAIVIIVLTVAVTPRFIPAIDAPHNASNNVYCGNCQGETLLNSPFWDESGSYVYNLFDLELA